MNPRIVLDGTEAEVIRTILADACYQNALPKMSNGEWGIAKSVLHRLVRALDPAPIPEEESELVEWS